MQSVTKRKINVAVEEGVKHDTLKSCGVTDLSAKRSGKDNPGETAIPDYTPESHTRCLLCGKNNPLSLGLRFELDGEGAVRTEVRLNRVLQGYDGILHGGVISALLDAAMTHRLFHDGIEAVTGDLRIRFVHPVPCRGRVTVRSWILKSYPPLYSVRAELLVRGRVMAWGEGKFAPRREK